MPRALLVAALLTLCLRAATADPLLPLVGGELLRAGWMSSGIDEQTKDGVYRQRAELTCGPAALASLLTFYWRDRCSEDEIAKLAGTYERLGTSLLGLRDAARVRGHRAAGYHLTFPQLEGVLRASGLPLLAHYREPLEHFVVVVAVVGDEVLVSDPAAGSVSLSRVDFERRWSGVVLVLSPEPTVDRARVARRVASFRVRRTTLDGSARAWTPP
jgi:predicted double-glycine peptidase